ncbi:hypothetical protein K8I31_00935, partial [bacterium]|nr:hypothetical protein [bacterium]
SSPRRTALEILFEFFALFYADLRSPRRFQRHPPYKVGQKSWALRLKSMTLGWVGVVFIFELEAGI